MAAPSAPPIPEGYRTVTLYLASREAPKVVEFVQKAFGAEFLVNSKGGSGGMHAEMKIGDSRLMLGGGSEYKGPAFRAAIHLKVDNVDEVYARAVGVGGKSLHDPQDFDYGERGAGVIDVGGNYWYIATPKGETHFLPEMGTITPYLHARETGRLIEFLHNAFDAEEVMRHESKEKVIEHAKIRIGNSIIEMSEAHDQYQPLCSMLYLYVKDADRSYEQAVKAGGKPIMPPMDQPYGDRNGAVEDFNRNQWYVATRKSDRK